MTSKKRFKPGDKVRVRHTPRRQPLSCPPVLAGEIVILVRRIVGDLWKFRRPRSRREYPLALFTSAFEHAENAQAVAGPAPRYVIVPLDSAKSWAGEGVTGQVYTSMNAAMVHLQKGIESTLKHPGWGEVSTTVQDLSDFAIAEIKHVVRAEASVSVSLTDVTDS